MPAEVVGITSGRPVYAPEADEDVVRTLKTWLERAEAGEVVGVAVGALYRDNSLGQSMTGAHSRGLVGTLFCLCHRLTAAIDSE